MSAKAKFKCNFFNNGDVAYVHQSGIFDFVDNFSKYAPKAIKKVSKNLGQDMATNPQIIPPFFF